MFLITVTAGNMVPLFVSWPGLLLDRIKGFTLPTASGSPWPLTLPLSTAAGPLQTGPALRLAYGETFRL